MDVVTLFCADANFDEENDNTVKDQSEQTSDASVTADTTDIPPEGKHVSFCYRQDSQFHTACICRYFNYTGRYRFSCPALATFLHRQIGDAFSF